MCKNKSNSHRWYQYIRRGFQFVQRIAKDAIQYTQISVAWNSASNRGAQLAQNLVRVLLLN